CFRSCRCRPAFRWPPSRSARLAPRMRHCSPRRCSPAKTRALHNAWTNSALRRLRRFSRIPIHDSPTRSGEAPAMSTIGILGGGQLARMLALAGAPLGARFLVVDNVADACAGQVAPLLVADWRDFAALEKFAARVDVVTFDFENVPADSAQWLAERTRVSPNPRALALAQDRLAEKSMFRELGLPTAD